MKFYRPGRWTKNQILEEHQFLQELEEFEIPVVSPQTIQGTTLSNLRGFCLPFSPTGGRTPEPENMDSLFAIGRYVGRMHACGAKRPFQLPTNHEDTGRGAESTQWLCEQGFIPNDNARLQFHRQRPASTGWLKPSCHFCVGRPPPSCGDCHAGQHSLSR